MGADLCIWSLGWPKDKKLNWKAGKKAIDALEDCQNYSKEELHNYLEDIQNSFKVLPKGGVSSLSREVVIFDCGHFWNLITGGMSWGETPTELGNAIGAFESDAPQVLSAIGFDWGECMTDWKAILIKVLEHLPKHYPALLGLDDNLDPILERLLKHPKEA